MTIAIHLDPDRLNSVRRARKLGRPKLAKLAGVTERQIARLEGSEPLSRELTHNLVARIAAALQIAPEVLTGEAPLTEADLSQASATPTCRTGCCG